MPSYLPNLFIDFLKVLIYDDVELGSCISTYIFKLQVE